MQPYQEASNEIRRQGERPVNAIKTAASIGAGYAGGALLGRVMPLLSKYVPEDLAIKGLSKVDPRFGKFIKTAMANGTPFEEVKSFIEEKAKSGEEEEKPKESRNVIQQYSPELHQFIDQEVKKGRKPIEAGAIAQADKRFKDIITKLTKDHQTPWSNILEGVYGAGSKADLHAQGQQPKQQSGQGQQALMAILQKIQQSRGG